MVGRGEAGGGGEEGVGLLEEIEVGLGESLEDEFDFGKEFVCSELGSPSVTE